jgi:hypothetical protein
MLTVKELCRAYLEPHDDCTIDDINSGKTVYDGSIMDAAYGKYSDFEVESFSSTSGGICINVYDNEVD